MPHSLDQILPLSDFEALTVHGELHRAPVDDVDAIEETPTRPQPSAAPAPNADLAALATFPTEFPA